MKRSIEVPTELHCYTPARAPSTVDDNLEELLRASLRVARARKAIEAIQAVGDRCTKRVRSSVELRHQYHRGGR